VPAPRRVFAARWIAYEAVDTAARFDDNLNQVNELFGPVTSDHGPRCS
jgi:hypothetical protein